MQSNTNTRQNFGFAVSLFSRGREVGFVVLSAGQILRYGVKTIRGNLKGKDLAERVEKALAPVVEKVGSRGLIVVERHPDLSRTGALCRTINVLAKKWNQQGFQVRQVSIKEAKKKLCEDPKTTQRELTEKTVEQYPLLWGIWGISNAHLRTQPASYWKKVILAVALLETLR